MSTRFESWDRLSKAEWLGDGKIQALMVDKGATPLKLADGAFSLLKDDYRVEVGGCSAEELIYAFADDPNATVNHGTFNSTTTFTRRPKGTPPAVGDMYILQFFLLGIQMETGAIMTVRQSANFGQPGPQPESWFVIQALETDEQGTMPEFGAREFGIEREGAKTFFYVRGASRARGLAAAIFGKAPQQRLWVAAMEGISARVRAAGGWAGTPERHHDFVPMR